MTFRLHAVNVFPPLSPDKRRKCEVRVELIVAESEDDAMKRVHQSLLDHEKYDYKLTYRNEFDFDEMPLTWVHQTWDRDEYPTNAPFAKDI